jgi:cell division protein YceG involved in septum cleavage
MNNDNMNNTPINYSYLTGALEGILKNLPDKLEREGVFKWNSKKYRKVQDIVEKEIARAIERERAFADAEDRVAQVFANRISL